MKVLFLGTGASGKKSAGLPTNETSQDQPSAPSSPAKSAGSASAALSTAPATGQAAPADQEVRKSRFTILPIAASTESQAPSEQPQPAPPPQNYQPTGTQGTTPVTGMTPESTIHQGGQSQQPTTAKYEPI